MSGVREESNEGIFGCLWKKRTNEKRTRENANLKTIVSLIFKKNQQIIFFAFFIFTSYYTEIPCLLERNSTVPEHVQRVVPSSQQTCTLMNLKVLCSLRLKQIKISQVSQFSVAAIPVLQQYEESDLFQVETCSVSFSSLFIDWSRILSLTA